MGRVLTMLRASLFSLALLVLVAGLFGCATAPRREAPRKTGKLVVEAETREDAVDQAAILGVRSYTVLRLDDGTWRVEGRAPGTIR